MNIVINIFKSKFLNMENEELNKVLMENEKLKVENEFLNNENRKILEDYKNLRKDFNRLMDELDEFKYSFEKSDNLRPKSIKTDLYKYIDEKEDNTDEEINDMSIISFLARSNKRVQILKSLNERDKIPSVIGKEIGDSSHHVSKYLKTLKEKELVICLNEEDKRFRYYSITEKGRKYLKIVQEKDF